MQVKIEPDRILCNFLRRRISDVNSSRSGQWIYTDFPRVASLGDASFPRIGITILSESEEPCGIYDDTQYGTVTLQLDIVTKKDLSFSQTVTNEAVGTVSSSINSDRLTLDYIPKDSTITIYHNAVAYVTCTKKALDSNFTAPASMAADVIEYSEGSGNLNLNATDVTGDDGEAITATYTFVLEGKKCCQHLARRVKEAIVTYWRTDDTLKGLFYPQFIRNEPTPIDEDLGIYRQVMEIRFNAFNVGRGL